MESLFQTVNQHVRIPALAQRQREWMIPGEPRVVVPYLSTTLYVDRDEAGFHCRIGSELTAERPTHNIIDFYAIPRAMRFDASGRVQAVLVEYAWSDHPILH